MSDTVKLIIEIPKEVKADIDSGVIRQNIDKIYLALAHGTPLDEVKAEIDKAYDDLDGYDPYALGTFANMVSDILDNIGKAESEDKE